MTSRAKTPSRLLLTVAFAISAMLLGIIGAVAAGTGTVTPPPKIAFVTTNANVAPDALTVGPMAGRLGAPLFITNSDNLGEDVKDALVAYGADLIIVAGGPNTVTDGVMAQISAATGKAIKDIADTPTDGIVRVAGSGRDQTAVALSELIAAYNPKFLPTDATAADSDLLDGKDSTAFLGATAKATDADKLDGIDSTSFLQNGGEYEFQVRDWRAATDGALTISSSLNTFEVSPGTSSNTFVIARPDIPKSLFGVTMAVKSFTVCFVTAGSTVTFLNGGVYEQGTISNGTGVETKNNSTDTTGNECRTNTLDTPASLAGNRYFAMALGMNVTASSTDIGAGYVTLVPAP